MNVQLLIDGILNALCVGSLLLRDSSRHSVSQGFGSAFCIHQSISVGLQFNYLLQAYHDTDVGIWEFGTTITTSCLFVMLFHVAIETRSWVSCYSDALCCIWALLETSNGFPVFQYYSGSCISSATIVIKLIISTNTFSFMEISSDSCGGFYFAFVTFTDSSLYFVASQKIMFLSVIRI